MITGYAPRGSHGIRRSETFKIARKRHRERMRRLWKAHGTTIKPFLPYAGFIVYACVGALVLHVIENYAELVPDNRSPDGIKCLRDNGYWAAMFYVISVCSTIGFGVIYPCTTPTRVLSVIYSFIGIPLVLYILADLGKRMCIVVTTIYVFFHRRVRLFCYRRTRFRRRKLCTVLTLANCANVSPRDYTPRYNKSYEPPDTDNGGIPIPYVDEDTTRSANEPKCATEEEFATPRLLDGLRDDTLENLDFDDDGYVDSLASEEIVDVPIFIGLIMLFICIQICAVFYYNTECYTAWESLYYSLLTFLSGDFITQHFEWSAPAYTIIFLGFSTLTMTVTIVQNNMQNMLRRVKRDVQREMIKKQEIAEAAGVVLPDDNDVEMAEDLMIQAIRKQGMGGWITSDKDVQKLDNFVKETAQKRNASTQTPTTEGPKKPAKAFRSIGTSCWEPKFASTAVGTYKPLSSTGSNTNTPKRAEVRLQFDTDSLRALASIQCLPSDFETSSHQQTTIIDRSDQAVAVKPRHSHWVGQTSPVELKEQAAQNTPETQHVSVQMSSALLEGRGPTWKPT